MDKQTLDLGMFKIQAAPHRILAARSHCDCNRILRACSFHSLGFVTLQEKQGITKASNGSKEGKRAAKILHSVGRQRKAAACKTEYDASNVKKTLFRLLSFIILQLSYDFHNTTWGEERKTQLHPFFSGTHLTYFPSIYLPCSGYFLAALKSSKWSTPSQSLIRIIVKCFQQNPFCYCTLMATEAANLFRDALTMKHHFENTFAAVHISFQSLNCELYLSKPLKKRGGLSGGCEGGEKRKEFLPNKRAPRKWYNFAGSYSQPTQHFFLYTDIPESQQGAFSPAKIWTISKSDHHQGEIRQPSGCKAKHNEIIWELCKPKSHLWELTMLAASHKHLPSTQHTAWQSKSPVCSPDKTCLRKIKAHKIPSTFPGLPRRLVKNSTTLLMFPEPFYYLFCIAFGTESHSHSFSVRGQWQCWERPGQKEIPQNTGGSTQLGPWWVRLNLLTTQLQSRSCTPAPGCNCFLNPQILWIPSAVLRWKHQ